jgi:hypothetical protein
MGCGAVSGTRGDPTHGTTTEVQTISINARSHSVGQEPPLRALTTIPRAAADPALGLELGAGQQSHATRKLNPVASPSTTTGLGAAQNYVLPSNFALFDPATPFHNPRYDVNAPHNQEFLSLLQVEGSRKLFVAFLAKSYCDFQITFCEDVQRFRQLCGSSPSALASSNAVGSRSATGLGVSPAPAPASASAAPTAAQAFDASAPATAAAALTDSEFLDRAIRERADYIYSQYIRAGAPLQVFALRLASTFFLSPPPPPVLHRRLYSPSRPVPGRGGNLIDTERKAAPYQSCGLARVSVQPRTVTIFDFVHRHHSITAPHPPLMHHASDSCLSHSSLLIHTALHR